MAPTVLTISECIHGDDIQLFYPAGNNSKPQMNDNLRIMSYAPKNISLDRFVSSSLPKFVDSAKGHAGDGPTSWQEGPQECCRRGDLWDALTPADPYSTVEHM